MRESVSAAEAKKLRQEPVVESAEVKRGSQGVYIEVTPTDRIAQQKVYELVDDYVTWIEVNEW